VAAGAPLTVKRSVKRGLLAGRGWARGQHCDACGMRSVLEGGPALWPELIDAWELSPEWVRWFDEREGRRCTLCGSSRRTQQLAQGLLTVARDSFGINARSLKALCSDERFGARSVAEVNRADRLHQFLRDLPNLHYSEYGSTSPEVPSEDLLGLSYADQSFDVVVTSDTLEHVPDVERALREIRRVLKRSGWHVFTVPVVWDRATTRRRASVRNDGEVIHLLPPSYHGNADLGAAADLLVFYEFGREFVEQCERAGFAVRVLRDQLNPAMVTFLTQAS
jgi:SAM-dependent methyltransferase